ncbi:SDR family oxidoreductase [bacterium]|nr:SDR family oxidoreductase [bacterium]
MKVAVITGTSSGMGEAFATSLLSLGWKVYGISRRTNETLVKNEKFRQITRDLSQSVDKDFLEQEIGEKQIHLLVNNAGYAMLKNATEWDQKEYEKMFAVHYAAPIQLLLGLQEKLTDGLVISVLSTASHVGWNELAYYGASKAALWLHMKAFVQGNPRITSIALHPSMVSTELTDKLGNGEYFDDEERKHFMKTKDIVTIFQQLVSGVLTVPSGSSIFIYNEWETSELPHLTNDMFFYNSDTESLTPAT